jgi:hypothetical protein
MWVVQLVVVSVEMGASLKDFKEAIKEKMGIMIEQQRIIVVGKSQPNPSRTPCLRRIYGAVLVNISACNIADISMILWGFRDSKSSFWKSLTSLRLWFAQDHYGSNGTP